MTDDTTSADFFNAKYRQKTDPWDFSNSVYEQFRYDSITQLLEGHNYKQAFEPGCSIGVLTKRLSFYCQDVEATDISEVAIDAARVRCNELDNVLLYQASLKETLPRKSPDLLILSEIGYYFQPDEWAEKVGQLIALCQPSATIVACHWLGASKDHLMSGDEVHSAIENQEALALTAQIRHENFRLDKWEIN